jgi:hypothetical protein
MKQLAMYLEVSLDDDQGEDQLARFNLTTIRSYSTQKYPLKYSSDLLVQISSI